MDSPPLGPSFVGYGPNPPPVPPELQYDGASTTLWPPPMRAPSLSSESSSLSSLTQAGPPVMEGPPLSLGDHHVGPFPPEYQYDGAPAVHESRSAQAYANLPMDGPPLDPNLVGYGPNPAPFDPEFIYNGTSAIPYAPPMHACHSSSQTHATPPMTGGPSPASPPASYGTHAVNVATHIAPGPQSGTPTVYACGSSPGTYVDPPHPDSPPAPPSTQPTIPKYRYGVVAAVRAHAHLLRINQQIEELLDSHGIGAGEWNAQAGFKLKQSKDGEEVELPSTLLQEIVITFVDYASVKGKLPKFTEQLKGHIAPFYGAVQYRNSHKTIDLKSESDDVANRTNCSKELLVVGCSGSRGESLFDADEPDPSQPQMAPSVKLSVINFANDQDPENHFATSAAFTLEKVDKSSPTSNPSIVKFSELRFAGPRPYRLQSSFARVIFDQPSSFENVLPDEMFEIDAAAQFKHNAQKTKGKEVQRSAEVGLGMDPKITVGAAQVDREEDVKAEETMRNCWQIRHSEDETSKTIRYFSMRPEFKERMSFPATFRPSMASTPNKRSSLAQTVTVRVWSFWTLASASTHGKESMMRRIWHRIVGKPSESSDGKARTYTNVVHCIEAIVPLCFVGTARKTVVREDVLDRLLDGAVSSVSN